MNRVKLRRPIMVGMKREYEDMSEEGSSDEHVCDELERKRRSILDDIDDVKPGAEEVEDVDLDSGSFILPDDDDIDESSLEPTSVSPTVDCLIPSVACAAVQTPATVTAPTTAVSISVPVATPPALLFPNNNRPLPLLPQQTLSLAVGPEGQLFVIAPPVAATDTMTNATRRSMALRAASMASSLVLPAPSSSSSSSSCSSISTLVREDRRRITHNEVERRRRDKINTLIMRLADIIPDCPTSKSDILCKACDYVVELQDLLIRLQNKLSEVQNSGYEEKMADLRKENQMLREALERHGIMLSESDVGS